LGAIIIQGLGYKLSYSFTHSINYINKSLIISRLVLVPIYLNINIKAILLSSVDNFKVTSQVSL